MEDLGDVGASWLLGASETLLFHAREPLEPLRNHCALEMAALKTLRSHYMLKMVALKPLRSHCALKMAALQPFRMESCVCLLCLLQSHFKATVHPKELLQSHFANCLGLMCLLKLRSRYALEVASEILVLLQLSCAPLKSFSQDSVHVYARVHTSNIIYDIHT